MSVIINDYKATYVQVLNGCGRQTYANSEWANRRAINETSVLYNRLLLSVLESIVLIDTGIDLFLVDLRVMYGYHGAGILMNGA